MPKQEDILDVLVASERDAHSPPGMQERVWQQLRQRADERASSPLPFEAEPVLGKPAGRPPSARHPVRLLGLGGLAIAAAAAFALWFHERHEPPNELAAEPPSAFAATVSAPPTSHAEAAAQETQRPKRPPAPPLASSVARQSAPKPEPAAPPASAASLGGELEIMRRINLALSSGNGGAALRSIQEHAERYPNGALLEEREAARIRARCALGEDAAARALAQAFRAQWPSSVHRFDGAEPCPR